MMKTFILLATLLLLCASIFVEKSTAVTAYPYPVTITQRDGSKLTVIMQGDERVKWAKTTDGYSLIYNRQGVYEYAKLDASGDMVPHNKVAVLLLISNTLIIFEKHTN